MLSSIHPLGERGRGNRYAVTASAHLLGALTGGIVLGGGAGAVASVFMASWPIEVLAATAVIAVAADLASIGVPTTHRQVNERWLGVYRGTVYGGGFGFQLGLGVVTVMPTWLVPATVVLAAGSASAVTGAMIGAVFGAARGATVLLVRNVDTVEALQRFHRSLEQRHAAIRVAVLALVTAIAGLVVVGT